MSSYWHPSDVLDVEPLGGKRTCTGTTQKGGRCQNADNEGDRKKAAGIIGRISNVDIAATGLTATVREAVTTIAELTLCLRWHRKGSNGQVLNVASKWCNKIQIYIVSQRSPRQPGAVHPDVDGNSCSRRETVSCGSI